MNVNLPVNLHDFNDEVAKEELQIAENKKLKTQIKTPLSHYEINLLISIIW